MERQPAKHLRRFSGMAILHEPKALEQSEGDGQAIVSGPLKPFECGRVAAPTENRQHGLGQVDALHFGLPVWPQSIAWIPQPPDRSRSESCGTAGSLVRGIGGDALERQAIDTTLAVVAGDLVQA